MAKKISDRVFEVLSLISNGMSTRAALYEHTHLHETRSELSNTIYECVRGGFARKTDDGEFFITNKGINVLDNVEQVTYAPAPAIDFTLPDYLPATRLNQSDIDVLIADVTKLVTDYTANLKAPEAPRLPDDEAANALEFIAFAEGVAKLAGKDYSVADTLRRLVSGG